MKLLYAANGRRQLRKGGAPIRHPFSQGFFQCPFRTWFPIVPHCGWQISVVPLQGTGDFWNVLPRAAPAGAGLPWALFSQPFRLL